jgi:hypothetical protein
VGVPVEQSAAIAASISDDRRKEKNSSSEAKDVPDLID